MTGKITVTVNNKLAKYNLQKISMMSVEARGIISKEEAVQNNPIEILTIEVIDIELHLIEKKNVHAKILIFLTKET